MARTKPRIGRPPEPTLGALNVRFTHVLMHLKNQLGLSFRLWPAIVGISHPTWVDALEGRGVASFVTLSAISRVAAIARIPAAHVTRFDPRKPLPPAPAPPAPKTFGEIAKLFKEDPQRARLVDDSYVDGLKKFELMTPNGLVKLEDYPMESINELDIDYLRHNWPKRPGHQGRV